MGFIKQIPSRVRSAVVFQTIGLSNNRDAFMDMFDGWARDLKTKQPDVDEAAWEKFKHSMFGGEFLFNVDEAFVTNCRTPLMVLMGNDLYHPEETSRKIATLAPSATFVEYWKESQYVEAAKTSIFQFLATNSD
ncbi:MAG: hypothetical protein AAF387_14780 [Pseudomonadota bacterium]